MELIQPFETVYAKSIDEATAAIVALTHNRGKVDWFDLTSYPLSEGSKIPEALIRMFDMVESGGGLSEMALFAHSSVYYQLRLHWPDSLKSIQHSSAEGDVSEFLGHHFFAHPRFRRNAILVGGLRKEEPVAYGRALTSVEHFQQNFGLALTSSVETS